MKKLLTLFFAATAPPAPDWFRPNISTGKEPEYPGRFQRVAKNFHEVELINSYYRTESRVWKEGHDIPKDLMARVNEHAVKVDTWRDLHDAWTEENRIQTIVQWRWHYANQMMKGRRYE